MTADLIARLEAAMHGSFELDREIAVASGVADALSGDGAVRRGAAFFIPKPYSVNLDAAVTLIGSECFWRIGHDGEGPNPADFLAEMMTADHRPVRAVAATAALALCSAALKARSAP